MEWGVQIDGVCGGGSDDAEVHDEGRESEYGAFDCAAWVFDAIQSFESDFNFR